MERDTDNLVIADCTAGDIAAVTAIYAHHVLNGSASFEEVPPPEREILERYENVQARGLPYILALHAGRITGYAYAAPYRLRSAYRYTLEDSIYLDPAFIGRNIGTALLSELLVRCEALGYRQMIAVIGDSGNAASIRLHARHGFTHAGLLKSAGFKFGRWVDSVLMQRPIGAGDAVPPEA
jgi:L-amino acid N-acyltransferase YncA